MPKNATIERTEEDNVTITLPSGKKIETTGKAMKQVAALGMINSQIIAEMSEAVQDLTFQNWPHIARIMDASENPKMAISFSFEIDKSGPQSKVTSKISYAEKFKDEREQWIKDPNQTEMTLDDSNK